MNDPQGMWERAAWDYHERFQKHLFELDALMEQKAALWQPIPAARLRARRTEGLEDVAEALLDAVARLRAATELKVFECQHDGVLQLEKLYANIYGAATVEEKVLWIDRALGVLCQSSDLAALIVEGGSGALSDIGDPDEVDAKALLGELEPTGFGINWKGTDRWVVYDTQDDRYIWQPAPDKKFIFGTRGVAEIIAGELADRLGSEYREYAKNIHVLPVFESQEGEEEDFDPDVPPRDVAKNYVMRLDQRGHERYERLGRIHWYSDGWTKNGEWYVPNTWAGYEADFDSTANHAYFAKQYPWLQSINGRLGLDEDNLPDGDHEDIYQYLAAIDETEWDRFMDDVKAAQVGAVDEQASYELQAKEEERYVREDVLPDLIRELKQKRTFLDSFCQFVVSMLTADDLFTLMREFEMYPEHEGGGHVHLRTEPLVAALEPERVQQVIEESAKVSLKDEWAKEKRASWELDQGDWFLQALNEAASNDHEAYQRYVQMEPDDLYAVFLAAVPDSNYGDSDLPQWEELQADKKAPRWVVRFMPDVNYLSHSQWEASSKQALEVAAQNAVGLVKNWSRPVADHPELPLGESGPDQVDPRDYLSALASDWGIAFQSKGKHRPVWYTGNPWDRWSLEVSDAKVFKSEEQAVSFINAFKEDKAFKFQQKGGLVALRLHGIRQEAVPRVCRSLLNESGVDPDDVRPHDYLGDLNREYVLKYTHKRGGVLYYKGGGGAFPALLANWSSNIDDAKRYSCKKEIEQVLGIADITTEGVFSTEFAPEIKIDEPSFTLTPVKKQTESVDPDDINPRDYIGKLNRKYVARIDDRRILRNPDGSHRGVEDVPLWFSDNPFGWWPDRSKAKVYNSPAEMYEVYLGLPNNRRKSVVIEPAEIVSEARIFTTEEAEATEESADDIEPRKYLSNLKRGLVLKYVDNPDKPWWYTGVVEDSGATPWTRDIERAFVFPDRESVEAVIDTRFHTYLRHHFAIDFVPEINDVQEARPPRKQLPPEEEIDYKKYVTHGGYDSGKELYSDATVRVFIPSTPHTMEKYGFVFLRNTPEDWDKFVEPGPVFLVIPTNGSPWAFREWYDELRQIHNDGRAYTVFPDTLLKEHPKEGKQVGQVVAAYFKKKLKTDFNKYFRWMFEFGGLASVRGYLRRIKPGQSESLDNAIGMAAALEGDLKLAAKFWNYPSNLLTTEGAWIAFDDWRDLSELFYKGNRSDYQQAAEKVFDNETYDWFSFVWETPIKLEDVTGYLTPEHYNQIREALVGRSVIIDDQVILLTSKTLSQFKDADIREWLENADDYQDGRDLEDITDALDTAAKQSLEQIYQDAYYTGYTKEVEEAFGSQPKWIKIGDKDKLGFLVSWKRIREWLSRYEEENGQPYDGSLSKLPIDGMEKITPAEEYHGSLDDQPDTIKERLSEVLSELKPVPLQQQHEPNQPEFFDEQPPKNESIDPDEISSRQYISKLKVTYVIAHKWQGSGTVDYLSYSGAWTTSSRAHHFDSLADAQARFDKMFEEKFGSEESHKQFKSSTWIEAVLPVSESLLLEGYKYAVTLIPLPREIADFVTNWGKTNIPDEWLYTEEGDDGYGRETESHITVKYGLTVNDVPDELREIAATTRPFPVFFEKVTLFDTNPDYDVVKIDIESPWLRELNARVSAQIPNEDKHPKYHPHCTVAYVKKGVANKLAGLDIFGEGAMKPQFTAMGMEFKGACENDDDPARTKESLLFSTVKKPQIGEGADPDDVDPHAFVRDMPVYYHVIGKWKPEVLSMEAFKDEVNRIHYLNTAGSIVSTPQRLVQNEAEKIKEYGETAYPFLTFQMVPAADQSQMFWQGRRWPQDFPVRESGDPDQPPSDALKKVAAHYLIKGTAFWWNKDHGWRADRAKATWYDSPHTAAKVITDKGLVAEIVPVIESKTPDPFGHMPFPTDASQVIRFLRSKRQVPQVL